MPYFTDPNLEEEDKQAQNPSDVKISGASPTTENTGGTPQQPNGGVSTPQAQQQAGGKDLKTGSGFQNLDKYIDTNQPQQFGQQFLGKVSDQVTDASQKQSQAADEFKNQVTSANSLPTQDQINGAVADPTKADPAAYKTWRTQSYGGPQSLGEDQDAWNKYWSSTNQANTSAQQLGTEPGRFTLLDSYFGRPQYNFGEKSLDNLLVQNAGLGQQTKDVQKNAAGLVSQGTAQAKDLQSYASQRAGEVDQSKNAAQAAVGIDANGQVVMGDKAGAIGKTYQQVQDELAATNASRASDQSAVQAALASGKLTPQQLQALGLTSGENVYNLDLTKYLTNNSDLNRDQTMTADERSRIQALSQLAGIDDSYANGTAQDPTSAYTFDQNRFGNDLSQVQGAYNSESSPINAQIAANQKSIADYQKAISLLGISPNSVGGTITGGAGSMGSNDPAQAQAAYAQYQAKIAQAQQNQAAQQAALQALIAKYNPSRVL